MILEEFSWKKGVRRAVPFLMVFGLGPAILVLMLVLVLSLDRWCQWLQR